MKLLPAFRALLLLCLTGLMLLLACGRGEFKSKEVAYVSAPQAVLRDRLAPVYNKVATVNNGDRVEILETKKRFARVRTAHGEEGWVEMRHLVEGAVFDGFAQLSKQSAALPAQAPAVTHTIINLHLTPDRDSEHLYQLKEGARLDVLKRATAERAAKVPPSAGQPEAPKVVEDWWLVRDAQGRAGWALARMVDIDAPLDVAQYSEGQRIVGCFVLNRVTDADKQVAQYLVLLTDAKDGQPFDYTQARIFTWNLKRHRYETAYRERKLAGFFPTQVGHEQFGNQGDLPTFVLHTQDADGHFADRKYTLNGPIVHRVLSPEEQAQHDAEPPARPRTRRVRK